METKIDKKKIRDYAFKAGIGVIFLGIVYAAISPSSDAEEMATGLNTELPDGEADPLKNKMKAYEDAPLQENKERHMKSLNDYVFDLKRGKANNTDAEKDFDVEIKDASEPVTNGGLEAIRKSLQAKQQSEEIENEYYRIQAENERLRSEASQLRRELKDKKGQEQQLAIMEKSYELAARYGNKEGATSAVREDMPAKEKEEATVDVMKKDGEIVSTLSEELLLDEPYNYGFNTAVGTGYETGSNTIRAAINGDQTVTIGDRVMLRLLEPLQAGNTMIPRNHPIAGTTRIQGDRIEIRIESIEYEGNIIPVKMKVYDTDGMAGIYCPSTPELDALKEGAANIGSGLGSSISFTSSAGQQVAMDLTRGVMNGLSQYVSKKARTVKVKLKSNYEVLLLPLKN